MNKEELQQENERLKVDIQSLMEESKEIRGEFGRAFGWKDENGETKVPSWQEIFIEVGKLLEHRNTKKRFSSHQQSHKLKKAPPHFRNNGVQ